MTSTEPGPTPDEITEAYAENKRFEDAREARELRARQALTLRALADFIERGDGPAASYIDGSTNVWCAHSKEHVAELMRDAARAGWKVEKHYEHENYEHVPTGKLTKITVTPPGGLGLDLLGAGSACTAVVVGQEEVEVVDYSVPQPEAPAPIMKKVTRDKIEWKCEPVLAGLDA